MKNFEKLARGETKGANAVGGGWENLAPKHESWDEHVAKAEKLRAQACNWTREAAEDVWFEENHAGIEKGLNDFADMVTDLERDKIDVANGNYARADGKGNFLQEMTQYRDTQEKEHARKLALETMPENFERAQEIIEKDLNARLTKVEDLEILSGVDGSGVEKTETNYFDHEIPVYNMQGADLKMLTTSISYKKKVVEKLGDYTVGGKMMERLEVMPSLWLDNAERTHAENVAIKGTEDYGLNPYRGNTISASYTDVKKIPNKRLGTAQEARTNGAQEPYVVYGWDHVDAGSIINVADRDLNTAQMIGGIFDSSLSTSLGKNKLGVWDELENSPSEYKYNEVSMQRFTDNGQAKPPDYLVIENGQISDTIKHHAATFGVPIINVERKYYDQAQ